MGDNRDREIDIHGGTRAKTPPTEAEILARAAAVYEKEGTLPPRLRLAKQRQDALKAQQNAAPAGLFGLLDSKD